MAKNQAAVVPLKLCSVDAALAALDLGRTKGYELIATGEIETVKVGRRRLVVVSSLDAFIERRLSDRRAAS